MDNVQLFFELLSAPVEQSVRFEVLMCKLATPQTLDVPLQDVHKRVLESGPAHHGCYQPLLVLRLQRLLICNQVFDPISSVFLQLFQVVLEPKFLNSLRQSLPLSNIFLTDAQGLLSKELSISPDCSNGLSVVILAFVLSLRGSLFVLQDQVALNLLQVLDKLAMLVTGGVLRAGVLFDQERVPNQLGC